MKIVKVMNTIKHISFILVLGFLVTLLSTHLRSDFLFNYLQSNILGLLITLLAISLATLGLIASKIQDILDKYPGLNFAKTIKEMKISLTEQIVLIVISVLSLIILNSDIICFEYKDFTLNTILISVLIYSIDILRDTGTAVFQLISLFQDFKNKQ